MSHVSNQKTEYDQPGTGPFYVYDNPAIERAVLHGCLDEDVETGDSIACRECVIPPVKNGDQPSV